MVDRIKTINEIHCHNKRKDKYSEIALIYRAFDQEFWERLRPILDPITTHHNQKPEEIQFHLDEDVIPFAKRIGLRFTRTQDESFELADAAAYCHNFNKKIDGMIKLDWRKEINGELKTKLLKR